MVSFLLTYELSLKKNAIMMEMGAHMEEKWMWNLHIFRVTIQPASKEEVDELHMIIGNYEPRNRLDEIYIWKRDY